MSLALHQVALARGGRPVLPATTVDVPSGQLLGLHAPSGAGKSTLLSIAGLLQPADSGQVYITGQLAEGKVPAALRQQIGFLPQSPRSYADPRLTLAETICAPLAFRDRLSRPRPGRYRQQLLALCAEAALDPALLSRTPAQVSDGQLQRALLARALSLDPRVLLCDEPTSALDERTAAAVFTVLRARADQGAAVLVASHDRAALGAYCDRAAALHQWQHDGPILPGA